MMSKPQPVDFTTWSQQNLAKLATDLWDQNHALTEANDQLRKDLADAMKQARKALTTASSTTSA